MNAGTSLAFSEGRADSSTRSQKKQQRAEIWGSLAGQQPTRPDLGPWRKSPSPPLFLFPSSHSAILTTAEQDWVWLPCDPLDHVPPQNELTRALNILLTCGSGPECWQT